jgi:hypothetical protein
MRDKINNIKYKALSQQASGRTYRLIDMTDTSCGGTVIAINIDNRYFFATAAHVIQKDHRYRIVLRNKTEPAPLESYLSRKINIEADVGLLEIPKEKKHLIDSWLAVSDICTNFDQSKNNNVIVVGYPGQYIKQTPEIQITEQDYLEFQICSSLCYGSFTLPIGKWPSEGLSSQPVEGQDIFVDFDSKGDMFTSPPNSVNISPANSMQCPELGGMSGGGIWLLESENDPIWKPSVKLIGIQHSVKKDQWMRGTLIDCWLSLARMAN